MSVHTHARPSNLRLAGKPDTATVAAAVRGILSRELRAHRPIPTVKDVARVLCVSARTLQRRLAEVGQSYSKMRDRARFEEACRLLRGSDSRLIDIAYQLGYSDPTHFARAFQCWAGMGPRCFRQSMVEGFNGISTWQREDS